MGSAWLCLLCLAALGLVLLGTAEPAPALQPAQSPPGQSRDELELVRDHWTDVCGARGRQQPPLSSGAPRGAPAVPVWGLVLAVPGHPCGVGEGAAEPWALVSIAAGGDAAGGAGEAGESGAADGGEEAELGALGTAGLGGCSGWIRPPRCSWTLPVGVWGSSAGGAGLTVPSRSARPGSRVPCAGALASGSCAAAPAAPPATCSSSSAPEGPETAGTVGTPAPAVMLLAQPVPCAGEGESWPPAPLGALGWGVWVSCSGALLNDLDSHCCLLFGVLGVGIPSCGGH